MGDTSKRITCIVIEDEVLAIEMMEDYIGRREDLELLTIGTELSEVLSLLENHNPSIIFLDLVIPSGVCPDFHLGKLPATSSIVIVSGIPLNQYKGELPKFEIFELPKPVSFASFDKCVDEVLDKIKGRRYGVEL